MKKVIPWNIPIRNFTVATGAQGTPTVKLPRARNKNEASVLTHVCLAVDGGTTGCPGCPARVGINSTTTKFLTRCSLAENILSATVEATDGSEGMSSTLIWSGRIVLPDAFEVGIGTRVNNPTGNDQDFKLAIIGHIEVYED